MVVRALLVWLVLLVAAIANGAFRVFVLIPRSGERTGHVVSTLMLCVEIMLLSWLTIRWIAPPTPARAVLIGASWVVLTLLFEFGFGHYVAHKPWSELLADYDVLHGRIWILVLIATAVSPWLTGRARGLWSGS